MSMRLHTRHSPRPSQGRPSTRPNPEAVEDLFVERESAEEAGFEEQEMAAGPAVAQSADREEGPSGEDTLSLYLQEMGAHPLFSPAQEREVVQRLERVRGRYRRAVLFNGAVLDRVIDTFERVQKDQT